MTTVPDIPVVQLPAFEEDSVTSSAAASMWAVEIPRGRRPSPLTLAVLGVLAGIAAMALGAAAVISAGGLAATSSGNGAGAVSEQPAASGAPAPGVERRVLALLAKPSTERIVFTGSRGLVLAVGSGGRSAILIRGLERAAPGEAYVAWIVPQGAAPVRAARFVGTERAVFLSGRLGPRASVVVSTDPPVAERPARNRIVALRG